VVLVFWKIEVTFLILIKNYQRYTFKDVQFVMICPGAQRAILIVFFDALEEFTDLHNGIFCLPLAKRLILCPIETSWKIR
jgi:hypothetical protein